MSSAKPKVLVLSERCPDPTKSSAERRLAGLIDILADISEVCLATQYPEPKGMEPKWSRETQAKIAEWDGRWLQAILAEEQWDVCILEYWFFAEPIIQMIRARCPGCTIIVDSVDVHFKRELDGKDFGFHQSDVSSKKARELDVYRKSDGVIIVSEEDAQILRAEGIEQPLSFIPNIIAIKPVLKKPDPASLLFVGTFYHHPNTDGLGWFLDEVWPEVKANVPDAELNVIGPHAPDDLKEKMSAEGVNYLGYVENLDQIIAKTTISIAPLRYGAGMKGKVCEALMHGLPVVTTTTGAEGLSLIHGKSAFISDSSHDFASNITCLIKDPALASTVGANGQRQAESICSPNSISEKLSSILVDWLRLTNRTTIAHARWSYAKYGYQFGRRVRSLVWAMRRLKTSRSS